MALWGPALFGKDPQGKKSPLQPLPLIIPLPPLCGAFSLWFHVCPSYPPERGYPKIFFCIQKPPLLSTTLSSFFFLAFFNITLCLNTKRTPMARRRWMISRIYDNWLGQDVEKSMTVLVLSLELQLRIPKTAQTTEG